MCCPDFLVIVDINYFFVFLVNLMQLCWNFPRMTSEAKLEPNTLHLVLSLTLFHFAVCCCAKQYNQKCLEEKRVWQLTSYSQHGGKSRQDLKAASWGSSAETEMMKEHCLLACSLISMCSTVFLIEHRLTCIGNGTAHTGQNPPTWISNQGNAPQTR